MKELAIHTKVYGYATTSNDAWRDPNLRFEAKGMLYFLRHLPDNWTLRLDWVEEKTGYGREKVQQLIKELIDAGYIVRKRQRAEGTGKLGKYIYRIKNVIRSKEEPEPEIPSVDHRRDSPTQVDSVPLLSINSNILNTNSASPNGSGVVASPEKPKKLSKYGEVFDGIWELYPKDRRGNKDKCARNFAKLSEEHAGQIPGAIRAYIAKCEKEKTERKHIKYLEGFLSGFYWQMHATVESVNRKEPVAPAPDDRKRWEIYLDRWRQNDEWPKFLGPEPGFPDSKVPSDLLKFWEQDEADERVLKIWNWMPEHERRECEAGLRELPRWIETRAKIFDAARLGQAPPVDHGCSPCGLLSGLFDGGSGSEAGEVRAGSEP